MSFFQGTKGARSVIHCCLAMVCYYLDKPLPHFKENKKGKV